MKTRLIILIGLALAAGLCTDVHGQGTAFTYQGRLDSSGNPASGSYDFRFKLFLDSFGNTQAGSTVLTNGVPVTSGLFTAAIDFGTGVFTGTSYWLEVGVRTNGASSYTSLAPLQALTPSPYAIFANGASSAATATTAVSAATATTAATASAVGANGVNNVAIQNNAVTTAKIAGGQVVKSLNGLQDAVTLSGGDNVTITPSGQTLTIAASAGGWSLTGNAGTTPGANFVGTTDNQPLELWANGNRALRLEPTGIGPNTIGGFSGNIVGGGVGGATIAGGGTAGAINQVSSGFSAIGGGLGNTIESIGLSSVIAGGGQNTILSGCDYAFIGGGTLNTIQGQSNNTIGGGEANTNSGAYATIPGGYHNLASGTYSFAAGRYAQAVNGGAFVWADAPVVIQPFSSTHDNEFAARATGGVRFVTGIDASGNPTAGASLAPGGTAWGVISDRNAKKNFAPVDNEAVLEKLAGVPVEQWNYKWEEDAAVPHIGPMAQDFKRAFYPGRDDKSITTLEFDGVEIAAIQGLNRKLEEQLRQRDGEIGALKERLDKLERALTSFPINR
jgi:hypothetical protein